MNTKRALSLILAMLMLTAMLASCATKEDPQSENPADSTQADAGAADTTEGATEQIRPNLPDKDFGGHEFHILSNDFDDVNFIYNPRDIYAESQNSEVINDAVFMRNSAIEDRYNIKIKETKVKFSSNTFDNTFKKSILTGDVKYDLAIIPLMNIGKYALESYLLDFHKVPHIDFAKPWWDHNSVSSLSIGGKLYGVVGDLNNSSKDSASSIVFNKSLFKDNNLEYPYDLVNSGEWTLEKFRELCITISDDVNGDGKMDLEDRYGLIYQRPSMNSFLPSFGGSIAEKDANDIPYITMNSPKSIDAFNAMFEFLYDREHCVNVSIGHEADFTTVQQNIFQSNRGLFLWVRNRDIEDMRTMQSDFGILPVPKLNASQPSYVSAVNTYTGVVQAIPANDPDLERTGIILEALNAESHYTLKPAYFEINLSGKFARDEESTHMLEIIYDNIFYDVGDVYQIGGLRSFNGMSSTYDANINSYYEKNAGKAETDLNKLVTAIQALDQ